MRFLMVIINQKCLRKMMVCFVTAPGFSLIPAAHNLYSFAMMVIVSKWSVMSSAYKPVSLVGE